MFWRQKKVNTIQKNTVPVLNQVIYRARVKKYWFSCGMQNNGQKPHEMPRWATEWLAEMGIQMLGGEVARKNARALEVVGIAPGLSEVIKTKMNSA